VEASSASQSANIEDPPAAPPRPLLVYDGDCAFCTYWVHYWRALTGDAVDYRPYRGVAAQYPAVPLSDFERAVQYMAPNGSRASAAEESFLTLSHARGKGIWLALYRRLPGFAALSEWAYAFIAAHRSAAHRISLALWGRDYVPPRRSATVFAGALALLIVFCSLVEMDDRFGGEPPAFAQGIVRLIEPLHIVSAYGLFAVMTTQRNEIVIEGSPDGNEWREYEFRYKPGDVARRPRWNIPHQPRLDSQMWFAALDEPRRLPWFSRFLAALLNNEPTVTALLEHNPFPDAPPVYLRARFYDYRYASADIKAEGLWWDRRSLGLFFPEVRLEAQ